MIHVFVYGTLKEGFANFGINAGRLIPGRFRTVERYPLYIIDHTRVPWLVNRPGHGDHVTGQLFVVDAGVLADMDRLEQVDEPGWYSRVAIVVEPVDAPSKTPIEAFVYFGSVERLATTSIHAGPLSEFTLAHNERYRGSD